MPWIQELHGSSRDREPVHHPVPRWVLQNQALPWQTQLSSSEADS